MLAFALVATACDTGRDENVAARDTAMRDTAAGNVATADPITDVIVIVTAPDRMPLVGRRVQLRDVRVQTVTGDRTFWAGPDPSQQLFVVLDEQATPGTPTEGRVNVQPGQTVTVSGTIRELPADLGSVRQQWSLSQANETTLRNERVYLAADSVAVAGR